MGIFYVRSHGSAAVTSEAFNRQPGRFLQLPSDRHVKNLTIQTVVQMMCNEVCPGTVDTLRICAHGNSGGILLFEPFARGWVHIRNVSLLRPFADRMNPRGTVELHTCGTASDTNVYPRASTSNGAATEIRCEPGTSNGGRGRAFIQAMADTLGVRCTGALNCQIIDSDWNFEGPTITCLPSASR
jgi:hypothetical protein